MAIMDIKIGDNEQLKKFISENYKVLKKKIGNSLSQKKIPIEGYQPKKRKGKGTPPQQSGVPSKINRIPSMSAIKLPKISKIINTNNERIILIFKSDECMTINYRAIVKKGLDIIKKETGVNYLILDANESVEFYDVDKK